MAARSSSLPRAKYGEIPNEILLTCSGQLVTITRLIKSRRDIVYGSWIKSESPEFYSGLSLIDRSMQPMYETYTKESSALFFFFFFFFFFNDSLTGRSLRNVFGKQFASLFSRSFHCSTMLIMEILKRKSAWYISLSK